MDRSGPLKSGIPPLTNPKETERLQKRKKKSMQGWCNVTILMYNIALLEIQRFSVLLWPHDKAHRNSSLLVKTELVESELSLLPWWHLKWLGHQTLWVKTKWQLTKLMMWYYEMIWSRRRSKKMSIFFRYGYYVIRSVPHCYDGLQW